MTLLLTINQFNIDFLLCTVLLPKINLHYLLFCVEGTIGLHLKVYKRENFFGFDFEFFAFLWLVIPNYYFLEKFFSLDQY